MVRPVCVVALCATLCAGAILEQCGYGVCPLWFTAGAGIAVVEWICEKAITKIKTKETS